VSERKVGRQERVREVIDVVKRIRMQMSAVSIVHFFSPLQYSQHLLTETFLAWECKIRSKTSCINWRFCISLIIIFFHIYVLP
jgi:hypothetical protein